MSQDAVYFNVWFSACYMRLRERLSYYDLDEDAFHDTYLLVREKALCSVGGIADFEAYFRAQQLFGVPRAGAIDYSRTLSLDLSSVVASLAGPKRPQDRIALPDMRERFEHLLSAPPAEGGFGRPVAELGERHVVAGEAEDIGHGDVLIAAITSCTNTSNPRNVIAAALLARNAQRYVRKNTQDFFVHPQLGEFLRGDVVSCVDESGNDIARGVINYNAQEARRIVKLPTGQIAAVLGYIDEPELVHRDNLVLD